MASLKKHLNKLFHLCQLQAVNHISKPDNATSSNPLHDTDVLETSWKDQWFTMAKPSCHVQITQQLSLVFS